MTAEEIAKVLEDQVATLNYPSLDGYEIVDRVQDRLSTMAKAVRELADSGDVSSDLHGPTFAIVFCDQTYVLVDRGEARVDAIKEYVRAADLYIASLQRSIEGHRGDKEKLFKELAALKAAIGPQTESGVPVLITPARLKALEGATVAWTEVWRVLGEIGFQTTGYHNQEEGRRVADFLVERFAEVNAAREILSKIRELFGHTEGDLGPGALELVQGAVERLRMGDIKPLAAVTDDGTCWLNADDPSLKQIARIAVECGAEITIGFPRD